MPMHKTGKDDVDRIEDRPFPKDPSRVIAISDGVFAVALTLLILDVKPPTVSQALLASAIIGTAPRLGIFAMISPTLALVGIAVATIAPVASLVLFVAI